jgi:ribose transport system substrate-binding protein
MGYMGEELEKEIDTGFMWFDASNIDDPEIQAVLYE